MSEFNQLSEIMHLYGVAINNHDINKVKLLNILSIIAEYYKIATVANSAIVRRQLIFPSYVKWHEIYLNFRRYFIQNNKIECLTISIKDDVWAFIGDFT